MQIPVVKNAYTVVLKGIMDFMCQIDADFTFHP